MTNEYSLSIAALQEEIQILKTKLLNSNNAFMNVIGKNRDGILIFDEKGRIVYANPAVVDLFGRDLGALLGEQIGIFLNQEAKTEMTIINPLKGPLTVEFNIADTLWNNKPAKLASLRDVTEFKKTLTALQRLSCYDYLTDLANRVFFEETLKKAMHRADRIKKKIALFFLDMDGFKKVNDEYGHQIGDQLLMYAADMLKAAVRIEDTVSRLGGDEFAIIVERVEEILACEQIATHILEKINEKIVIDNHPIKVNFSIGIAIYPDNTKNGDELINEADHAMYEAKKAGKGCYRFFKGW